MTLRKTIALVAVLFHLVLVGLGALSIRLGDTAGSVGQRVDWYRAMSGANTEYAFFAPGVGMPVRLRFTLSDNAGQSWSDVLYSCNQEVNLRLLYTSLGLENPKIREQLLSTWAGKLLAKNPRAQRLVVHIEGYDLPAMSGFRANQRPVWRVEQQLELEWRGDLARALMRPDLQTFDISWLAQAPWLACLLCWGTVCFEIGYAFLIWPRKTRIVYALLTLGLHLGVAVFLGLWSFSGLMGVLTCSAFLVPDEPKGAADAPANPQVNPTLANMAVARD